MTPLALSVFACSPPKKNDQTLSGPMRAGGTQEKSS